MRYKGMSLGCARGQQVEAGGHLRTRRTGAELRLKNEATLRAYSTSLQPHREAHDLLNWN